MLGPPLLLDIGDRAKAGEYRQDDNRDNQLNKRKAPLSFIKNLVCQ